MDLRDFISSRVKRTIAATIRTGIPTKRVSSPSEAEAGKGVDNATTAPARLSKFIGFTRVMLRREDSVFSQ